MLFRWKLIRAVCVIPCLFIYLTWSFTPESPRWLMAVGRIDEACEIMLKLATTNGVKVNWFTQTWPKESATLRLTRGRHT